MSDAFRIDYVYPMLANLPAPLAYRAAAGFGWWSKTERIKAEQAYRTGLLQMFPALNQKPSELDSLVEKSLTMFAHEAMDIYRMPHLRKQNKVNSLVSVTGLDALETARRNGQGIIFLMAHYGRPLTLLMRLGDMGIRLGMITMPLDGEDSKKHSPLFRYLRQKTAEAQLNMGGVWLQQGQNMRPLYRGLMEGEIWVIMFDAQPSAGSSERMTVPFMNGYLNVPGTIIHIAKKCNARFVYACVDDQEGALQGKIHLLPENPVMGFQSAIKELEKDVAQKPWQWWHWNILDYIWKPNPNLIENIHD